MPVASVIIPTFNRAHLIDRAVASVQAQTMPDFELVVVDDGSTDQTDSVVAAYNDPRIRYIARTTNGGAAACRNTGIAVARGTFVAFLDSDDEWLPTLLERQIGVLERLGERYAMVYGGRIEVDSPGKDTNSAVGKDLPGGFASIEDLFTEVKIAPSNLVVRRSVFALVGDLDEDLASGEFYGLFIRTLENGLGMAFNPEPLVRRYRQPGSNGASPERDLRSIDQIRERFAHIYARSPRLTAHYHVHRAMLMLEARGRRAAIADIVKALSLGLPRPTIAMRMGIGLVGGFSAIQRIAGVRRAVRRELQRLTQ